MDSHEMEYGVISLRQSWEVFWRRKWIYGLFLVIVIAAAVALAVWLPDRYVARVLLLPSHSGESSADGLMSSNPLLKGAAASILGGGLGGGPSESIVGIETLKTQKFVSEFVRRHDFAVPLMAAQSWNPITRELKLDADIYSPEQKKWTRDVGLPLKPEPNDEEIVEEFLRHLTIDLDPETSVVTIEYEFVSPVMAKQWLEWMVRDLNALRRKEVREEKERMLAYLNKQLRQTNDTELRRTISDLIGEELKALTMIEARNDYVFRTLDPPIAPNKPTGPRRMVIVLLAFFAALVAILMAVLLEARLRGENRDSGR